MEPPKLDPIKDLPLVNEWMRRHTRDDVVRIRVRPTFWAWLAMALEQRGMFVTGSEVRQPESWFGIPVEQEPNLICLFVLEDRERAPLYLGVETPDGVKVLKMPRLDPLRPFKL